MPNFNSLPLVSIVFLCWNRKDDVREVLTRLRQVDYRPLEVILVDNASEDGTSDMVAADFPEVELILMPSNLGIAGYNAGFAAARGEFTLILDDDSFPAPEAVGRMVERFLADPQLGVVAFDVRNAASRTDDRLAPVEAAKSGYQMSFNGAGAGIRTRLFREIGWYPAEFFLYWNEQDTAFRVLAASYKIQSFADIVAWHKSSLRNRASERAPFFYTRNAFWLVWKHYPLDMALPLTLRLIWGCFYHSLEQASLVYLRALWSAFVQSSVLKGLRRPLPRSLLKKSRVVWELAFSQFK